MFKQAHSEIERGFTWFDRIGAIATLLAGLAWFQYQVVQIKDAEKDVDAIRKQTSRIEKYLASKDPNYWKFVKEIPQDDPGKDE